jgi:hypothetical protein
LQLLQATNRSKHWLRKGDGNAIAFFLCVKCLSNPARQTQPARF